MADRAARGLLDTNVVIHLGGVDFREMPIESAISAVTLAELSAGPASTDDPLERAVRVARLQRAEATYEALPFDADAARQFGPVSAAVRRAGRKPRRRLADLMIACVAIANDLPLFTVNPHDFAGLEGLLRVRSVTRPVK